jgi:hypothetical protein
MVRACARAGMNRTICLSGEPIGGEKLPPPRREPGTPARVLFLHAQEVGFATTSGNLIHYAGSRDDLDAVHVRLEMPGWLRLACTQFPVPVGELDYRYLRHMLFWRMYLRGLVGPGKKLPLERFDVVHIMTQQRGLIVEDFRRPGRNPSGTKFAINLDATLRNWESMRSLRRLAPTIDWSMEGRILRSADMLACATEWVGESCEKEYGVDRARVVIHKPCARVDGDVKAKTRLGEPGHPKARIIFIGGNWVDKGGPRLLKWHQERWAEQAELHVVSGSAPADARAKNVVWHGRVAYETLMGELLPSMDVFVVPTKWDTFMIAAQEAQGAGVPVVTTRTGGVGECVADGKTGFLCDRSSDGEYIGAVERLLGDAGLRERMGRAAREHVRVNLNADVWHNHLLDQLCALADGRPSARLPTGEQA